MNYLTTNTAALPPNVENFLYLLHQSFKNYINFPDEKTYFSLGEAVAFIAKHRKGYTKRQLRSAIARQELSPCVCDGTEVLFRTQLEVYLRLLQ